jgi:hypothetical protein
MNIHWKIFNVINMIHLVMVTGIFLWPFFLGFGSSFSDPRDIIFFVFLVLVVFTVIINCLHNISLTRVLAAGRKLTTLRKVGFWILLILFAAVVFLFIQQLFVQLSVRFTRAYIPRSNTNNLIKALSISLTGVYIIVMQMILFSSIKNAYRQNLDDSINEIGTE